MLWFIANRFCFDGGTKFINALNLRYISISFHLFPSSHITSRNGVVGWWSANLHVSGGWCKFVECVYFLFQFFNERSTSLQTIIINHIESAILRRIQIYIYWLTHKMLEMLCYLVRIGFYPHLSGAKAKVKESRKITRKLQRKQLYYER